MASLGDLQGKRGLAGLSRAEQGDRRRLVQQGVDLRGYPPLYHPCNYKLSLEICTDAGWRSAE